MRGEVPPLQDLADRTGHVPAGGLVFRPSLRAAVGSVLRIAAYTALVLGPPLVLAGLFGEAEPRPDPEDFQVPVWLLALQFLTSGAFPVVLAALAAVLKIAFTTYVVDDDGIHVRTRFLSSEEKRIPWEKVTAVAHRRTMFDTLLGVERLDVVSFGRDTRLHLVGLRGAGSLRDLVSARMRQSSSFQMLRRLD